MKTKDAISTQHRLVTDELGENYWFDGCAGYVMECLHEPDFDYNFFAGLTGDVFAQYYTGGDFRTEGVSGYMLYEGWTSDLCEDGNCFKLCESRRGFVGRLFETCGYSCKFVGKEELRREPKTHLEALAHQIDRGVPVIAWDLGELPIGVIVGYKDCGETLLYITGNSGTPRCVPLEKALESRVASAGWIFVTDTLSRLPLAEIYRERIRTLPKLLSTDTGKFCFGAGAFRAWADDIENGKFDNMCEADFNLWQSHTAYVCGLATNSSCLHSFLGQASESSPGTASFLERACLLNPDMGFLREISGLYLRCKELWCGDGGLEEIGGGFGATLKTLQDKQLRRQIAAKLREAAKINDEIVKTLNGGIEEVIRC